MGFDGYVSLFDSLAQRVASSPALLSADASSNTLTAGGVWRRGHHPVGDVTIGELMFEAAPYTRCIVMLREPGERLFSAFHYYRRMYGGTAGAAPASPQDFAEHVSKSIAAWDACVAAHNGDVAPCVRQFEPQQLIKGMYAQFFADWVPRFPADQFLVLRLEDYSGDMKRHLEAVFAFAGLRTPSEAEWGAIVGAPRANTRTSGPGGRRSLAGEHVAPEPMLPETRTALTAFYAPFNEALATLLGDERFAWRDAGGAQGSGVAA
jgi:N-acetylgalactosamine 4-sulfate 6-O-sulfotransferase